MTGQPRDPFYESVVPYGEARIRAAAVYCSDGRFGEQCDDLLQNALGLPRYDRLAVPGGAASLAGHGGTHAEEDAVVEELRFLVEVHELHRVVLIAHQDCAFYTTRLRVSPAGLAERQIEDLETAARRVRDLRRGLVVESWFAHRRDDAVIFERIIPAG